MRAVNFGKIDVVEFLAQNEKCDVNIAIPNGVRASGGQTSLMIGVRQPKNRVEILSILIENGANPNLLDNVSHLFTSNSSSVRVDDSHSLLTSHKTTSQLTIASAKIIL